MSILCKNIYDILIKTKLQFIYKNIYHHYNIQLNYIDFILFTPNFNICITLNKNIKYFIDESNLISQQLQKKCICLNLNMFKLTYNEEKLLIDENIKNINYFIYITGNDNKLIKNLLRNLYYMNIFCYDISDDCIMIE